MTRRPIRDRAREMLVHAGARAAALGAPDEGHRYFRQAADLTEDPAVQAELLERAGRLARTANHVLEARTLLERSLEIREAAGDRRGIASVTAALGDVAGDLGDLTEGIRRLELAVAGLESDRPDAVLADALAQLGRILVFAGRAPDSSRYIERALTLAERLRLPEVFLNALISKSLILNYHGRNLEGRILLEASIDRAGAEQLYGVALRASNNLCALLEASDHPAEAVQAIERAVDLARMRGDRRWEVQMRIGGIVDLYLIGRWDEALAIAAEEAGEIEISTARAGLLEAIHIFTGRGNLAAAWALFAEHETALQHSETVQARADLVRNRAAVLLAERRYQEALESAEEAIAFREVLDPSDFRIKQAFAQAAEAALGLGDPDRADRILDIPRALEPGYMTPSLAGQLDRFTAQVELARGVPDRVEARQRRAIELFRDSGNVVHHALVQLELAEFLTAQGRAEEARAPLAEARTTFERLGARPWLERALALGPGAAETEELTAPA